VITRRYAIDRGLEINPGIYLLDTNGVKW